MAVTMVMFAGALLLGGAVGVFRATRPRARLLALSSLAVGGVLLTLLSAPDRTAGLLIAMLSAATLTGLIAVASLLERRANQHTTGALDLAQDPVRWS